MDTMMKSKLWRDLVNEQILTSSFEMCGIFPLYSQRLVQERTNNLQLECLWQVQTPNFKHDMKSFHIRISQITDYLTTQILFCKSLECFRLHDRYT